MLDKRTILINKIYEVVIGSLTCVNNWAVYLFDPQLDHEVELRNKIGVIWICALMDTLEAQSTNLPKLIGEANDNGWDRLSENANNLLDWCNLTGELMDSFTKEEQIILMSIRNQLVHGYLSGRHNNDVSVKYYINGKFHKKTISHEEYSEITFGKYEKIRYLGISLDDFLQSLVSRALDKSNRYWEAIAVMQKMRDTLYKILKEDGRLVIKV